MLNVLEVLYRTPEVFNLPGFHTHVSIAQDPARINIFAEISDEDDAQVATISVNIGTRHNHIKVIVVDNIVPDVVSTIEARFQELAGQVDYSIEVQG